MKNTTKQTVFITKVKPSHATIMIKSSYEERIKICDFMLSLLKRGTLIGLVTDEMPKGYTRELNLITGLHNHHKEITDIVAYKRWYNADSDIFKITNVFNYHTQYQPKKPKTLTIKDFKSTASTNKDLILSYAEFVQLVRKYYPEEISRVSDNLSELDNLKAETIKHHAPIHSVYCFGYLFENVTAKLNLGLVVKQFEDDKESYRKELTEKFMIRQKEAIAAMENLFSFINQEDKPAAIVDLENQLRINLVEYHFLVDKLADAKFNIAMLKELTKDFGTLTTEKEEL